jgi:hypothetical protein
MTIESKNSTESEDQTYAVDSENYIENIRYMKMLKIQHSVLNKLVSTDVDIPAQNDDIDPVNSETN